MPVAMTVEELERFLHSEFPQGFHGTASVLLAKEGVVVAAHTPGHPVRQRGIQLFPLNSITWGYGSIIPSGGIE